MRAAVVVLLLLVTQPAWGGERAMVATVALEPATHTVYLPPKVGILRAVEERRLGFPVGGRLDVVVEEGAPAAAGETLAHLDERLANAQIAQAQIRLREAVSELHRARQLHEANAQSVRVREQAENLAELRRAEFEVAREQLAQRRITAPFDGVAVDVHAEPGEVLAPAAPVVTFLDLSVLRVELGVPGYQVVRVAQGAPALVTVIGDQQPPAEGVVQRVAVAAPEGRHDFEVEVRISNETGRLRAGMTARVGLVAGVHEGVLLVPLESVVERQGRRLAFFVEDGRAVAVAVDDAIRDGDVFLLPASRAERDLVVRGQRDLHDGTPVVVDNTVLAARPLP